jgi:predicted lipoprotein with Yx(FWY)xxD motif
MKKSNTIALIIVVVIIVAGGAYALLHKSSTSSNKTVASTSAPAVNNAVLITKTNSTVGQYLADPSGKPLYTYGGDSSGTSNCTGSCLANWPVYQDTGSTSNLPAGVGTIKRSDNGQTQYTYMGMPLYYFSTDGNGQVTGNGVDNFHIAKPSASSSQPSSTPSSSPSSQPSSSPSSSSNYNY